MPIPDFEDRVDEWLRTKLPEGYSSMSLEEMEFLAELHPDVVEVVHTIRLTQALRVALHAQQRRGFSEAMDAFETARANHGGDPCLVLQQLNADCGGVLVGVPGAWTLLLPSPFGDWALCDGLRLWRSSANPFQPAS